MKSLQKTYWVISNLFKNLPWHNHPSHRQLEVGLLLNSHYLKCFVTGIEKLIGIQGRGMWGGVGV